MDTEHEPDVAEWLASLKLEEYASQFREHGISSKASVQSLTDAKLVSQVAGKAGAVSAPPIPTLLVVRLLIVSFVDRMDTLFPFAAGFCSRWRWESQSLGIGSGFSNMLRGLRWALLVRYLHLFMRVCECVCVSLCVDGLSFYVSLPLLLCLPQPHRHTGTQAHRHTDTQIHTDNA